MVRKGLHVIDRVSSAHVKLMSNVSWLHITRLQLVCPVARLLM